MTGGEELVRRVWEWLPARTDSRRVTLPLTIATALGVSVRDVSAALVVMERRGQVVRNSATGRQTGWHRGSPPPDNQPSPEGAAVEEWTLY